MKNYKILPVLSFSIASLLLTACYSTKPTPAATTTDPACHATSLKGTIDSPPQFAKGRSRKGIELSHTNFQIHDTNTTREYAVNLDNVFADDYDTSNHNIPHSYASELHVGTKVILCGRTYQDNGKLGIHWVHTNCNNPNSGPNGYTIANKKTLSSNEEYCYLWRK